MATHTIDVSLCVDVTDASVLGSFGVGRDERIASEEALWAGLGELPALLRRYGFLVLDSSVSVSDGVVATPRDVQNERHEQLL
jgi:hypothetical protein